MKQITLRIYKGKKLENEFTNQVFVITNLMSFLYNKVIPKTKDYKRIKHSYNYEDIQTITFVLDNDIEYEFKNIPTSWGRLDTGKIEQLLKGGE